MSFSWSELFPGVQSWEFLGFVTGLLSVFLLLPTKYPRLQWTNWLFSIVSAAVYLYLFREWTLYGNAALQVPFIILSVLGAVVWIGQLVGRPVNVGTLTRISEIPTTYASMKHWLAALAIAFIGLGPVYPILDYYGDASPLWDGLILTLSLAAIYLQLRKYVQSWYLWIGVDLIAVPFHLSQERGATALLYFVYMLMCFVGWKTWHDETRMGGHEEVIPINSKLRYMPAMLRQNSTFVNAYIHASTFLTGLRRTIS